MELLEQAFSTNENGNQIFRKSIEEPLNEYLKFRHFIRHAYGFQFEWERMEDLVKNINDIWKLVKDDINLFIENN